LGLQNKSPLQWILLQFPDRKHKLTFAFVYYFGIRTKQ
jgi:hypothetical protein